MENDYISREAAIALTDQHCFETVYDAVWMEEALRNLRAADVRPVVSAEWERPKGSTPRSWIFVCSKCGDRAYFPVPKYFPKGCGYSFCPNCGADMREVQTDG